MITSSTPANGAPSVKKTIAIASSDTTRYNNACTGFVLEITIVVANSATAEAT